MTYNAGRDQVLREWKEKMRAIIAEQDEREDMEHGVGLHNKRDECRSLSTCQEVSEFNERETKVHFSCNWCALGYGFVEYLDECPEGITEGYGGSHACFVVFIDNHKGGSWPICNTAGEEIPADKMEENCVPDQYSVYDMYGPADGSYRRPNTTTVREYLAKGQPPRQKRSTRR